jgi:hypothetical protein
MNPHIEAPELLIWYLVNVQDDALMKARKLHVVTLHFLALFCAQGCAFAPNSGTKSPDPRVAGATAMCLAPSLQKAEDLASAVEPSVEAVKSKLSQGLPLTVVDIAPLVDLADLVLDVRACVLQVQASSK